jgi:hypothetical protein
MYILRIEHPVSEFDGWKRGFDIDPAGRRDFGARSYRIMRPIDNENYVLVDLEFDDVSVAEAYLVLLRDVWSRMDIKILMNPKARIVEVVDEKAY